MTPQEKDLPLFSTPTGNQADSSTGMLLSPTASLSAAINTWEEILADEGRSIHTVKAFTADLRLLAKYIGSGQSLNAIGTHDLKNFLNWMLNHRKAPCSPKTYARRVTSIKSFFRWLTEYGVLPADPAAAVPQQTVLSPLPEVLTRDEADLIMKKVVQLRSNKKKPDARPYVLVRLLLSTAIKKSECLTIHLNHIDLNSADGPVVYIRYDDMSKRYRERKLSLPADWIPAFHEYAAQYNPEDLLFPYSPRRLEYILEDIGEMALLDKHLSFNMCRWSSALFDYLEGAEETAIRHKLGVSKIQWREVGKKLDRLAAILEENNPHNEVRG
ncbi:MAG: site-specific integrase [Anaerolineales bacterium]|nr:site-specific integrase [Anaerolineales bacterium]